MKQQNTDVYIVMLVFPVPFNLGTTLSPPALTTCVILSDVSIKVH